MSEAKECIICMDPETQGRPLLNKSSEFENCECKNTYFHQDPCYIQYRMNARTELSESLASIQEQEVTPVAKAFNKILQYFFMGFSLFVLAYMIKGMTIDPEMSEGNFNSLLGFTCLTSVLQSIPSHLKWLIDEVFSYLSLERSRSWRQFKSRCSQSVLFKVFKFFWFIMSFTVFGCMCYFLYPSQERVRENTYLYTSMSISTITTFISLAIALLVLTTCCCVENCRVTRV